MVKGLLKAFLKSMDLEHLFTGWKGSHAAERRAIARIKKGESPYYVLTEENKIPVDLKSRNLRALKEGYGNPRDEVYHGTLTDTDEPERLLDKQMEIDFENFPNIGITNFWEKSHFGDSKAALSRIRDKGNYSKDPYYGLGASMYPVRLKEKSSAVKTKDLEDGDWFDPSLADYIEAVKEKGGLPSETMWYDNFIESEGAPSYINVNPNVRGRFAMHNPNWTHLKDLLAGAGGLTLLPYGEDF